MDNEVAKDNQRGFRYKVVGLVALLLLGCSDAPKGHKINPAIYPAFDRIEAMCERAISSNLPNETCEKLIRHSQWCHNNGIYSEGSVCWATDYYETLSRWGFGSHLPPLWIPK